ncbi:MAG: hypothetical protein ACREA0_10180 [bacterium]
MILSVRIDCWAQAYKDLTEEQWSALRAAIPSLPPTKPEWGNAPVVVDHDGLRALASLGLTVALEDDPQSATVLVKLQNRLEALGIRCDELAEACARGAAVQIALPDVGLLSIDEVDHLDNCCTDEVQHRLNEGWRILAVCPPNAQRRPDYIIGRRRA